jgi:hypothetical protein
MIVAGEAGQQAAGRKLTRSAIYIDYAHAVCDTTGMPIALRAVERWQLAQRGTANENPFRELMARSHETGRSRLR